MQMQTPDALRKDFNTKGVPAVGIRLVIFNRQLLDKVTNAINGEIRSISNSGN
jgi:hypothetical protein